MSSEWSVAAINWRATFWQYFCVCFGCATTTLVVAQSAHTHLRSGNSYYEQQDYSTAEENYRKTLEKAPNSLKGTYNLGNAIYAQKRYDEALKHYDNALKLADNNFQKSQIHYNMGNTYLQQRNYEKSIAAYKNALRLHPNDPNAKYNLAVARKKQEKEERQKQQNSKPNKDPKNPKNENPQAKNNATGGKKEDSKNENDSQASAAATGNDPTQKTKEADETLSKQQARQLLSIMDNEERKVQEKVNKAKGRVTKNGKDW